ncbi:DUF3515 domain-containing protein [Kitasatospora putterlickiae]|uniref:DUF3515 domain-containing protein n=1 Tax=Kitasatospora putterlickiae TaxID=221725 RepID=A0ABP4INX2_9ACTN
MTREPHVPRFLAALPAPVRWLAVPTALACTVVVLLGGWGASADPKVETPEPRGKAAEYCRALAAALPQELLGHARKDPSPASPYVAAWASTPRIVLRCGVPHPEALVDEKQAEISPTVNGVTWWPEPLGDGGYRFTATQRAAFVEVTVPGGAAAIPLDAAAALSDVVRASIP